MAQGRLSLILGLSLPALPAPRLCAVVADELASPPWHFRLKTSLPQRILFGVAEKSLRPCARLNAAYSLDAAPGQNV